MKKLNKEEIKQFANALSFTESEAKDITDLFYKLKMENPINHRRVLMPLNDVDEFRYDTPLEHLIDVIDGGYGITKLDLKG